MRLSVVVNDEGCLFNVDVVFLGFVLTAVIYSRCVLTDDKEDAAEGIFKFWVVDSLTPRIAGALIQLTCVRVKPKTAGRGGGITAKMQFNRPIIAG